jgi:hypothetical protein
VISKFSKNCYIPRGADGELKPASFGSSGVLYEAPGRAEFVHPHALSGVQIVPPPPPH